MPNNHVINVLFCPKYQNISDNRNISFRMFISWYQSSVMFYHILPAISHVTEYKSISYNCIPENIRNRAGGPFMKEITVVTGNEDKAKEVAAFFEGICAVEHVNLDLTEIQDDDIGKIAHFKAHEAYELLKKPLIVDDTGFFINAFKGFPGAYASYVLDTIGISGILSLLAGLPDRSGTFVTAIAYADSEGIQVFEGEVKGKITKIPRGDNGFGYDPIFEYEGRTFAEIPLKEKSMISHRARALAEFKKWFIENRA